MAEYLKVLLCNDGISSKEDRERRWVGGYLRKQNAKITNIMQNSNNIIYPPFTLYPFFSRFLPLIGFLHPKTMLKDTTYLLQLHALCFRINENHQDPGYKIDAAIKAICRSRAGPLKLCEES